MLDLHDAAGDFSKVKDSLKRNFDSGPPGSNGSGCEWCLFKLWNFGKFLWWNAGDQSFINQIFCCFLGQSSFCRIGAAFGYENALTVVVFVLESTGLCYSSNCFCFMFGSVLGNPEQICDCAQHPQLHFTVTDSSKKRRPLDDPGPVATRRRMCFE
jgi:hypothetical protein